MRRLMMTCVLSFGVTSGAFAQPTAQKIELPGTDAVMASNATTAARNLVGVWKCLPKEAVISCYGVYTRKERSAAEYAWSAPYWQRYRLIDNFKIEHVAVRGYYVNGRGRMQPKALLEGEDSIWFGVDFAGETDGVTSGKLIVPDDRGYGKLMLAAPVEQPASPAVKAETAAAKPE